MATARKFVVSCSVDSLCKLKWDSWIRALCIRNIIKSEISKGRGKKKYIFSEQFRTDRIAREDEYARQASIQAVVACSQFVTGNLRSELIYDLAFRNVCS